MTPKQQRGAYPYPVLDHTDEVRAEFSIDGNPQIEPSTETVTIHLEISLSEDIRNSLVATGQFSVVAHWRCTATLQSETVQLDTAHSYGDTVLVSFSIPLRRLVDTVQVSVMMVSDTDHEAFRWPSQNSDYGNATFEISKGDQVGFAGEFSFVAHRWFDPMVPPLESCIQFVQLTEPSGPFTVNLADDIIKVALPNDTYQSFVLQANRPLLQQSLFVVPALMYALDEMARDDGEHADKAWYRSIDQLLQARGIEGEESVIAVQKLLDYPAHSFLGEIVAGLEEIDE